MGTKKELHQMSQKELDRIDVLSRLNNKQLRQREAAQMLGITVRQMRRVQERYRLEGTAGLMHRRRGKLSNNRLKQAVKEEVLNLMRSRYIDFGPTFACEKLQEVHQISISVESLRQLMIGAKLWKGRSRKRMTVHQMRTRRACFGELIQMDGSLHDWFEGRGAKCCLIVLIDDASSRVVGLRFTEVESTQAYFDALEPYIVAYGLPVALYTDKHSIFRVNIPEAQSGNGDTQLSRVAKQLGVELICANSPQAKGRVERVNSTLQDRLVKEMRLRGISSIEAANAYLPEYLTKHNLQFSVVPRSDVDAHRKEIPDQARLAQIFSHQTVRKLSKNLELSYNNASYQIQLNTPGYAMRGAQVEVLERQGSVTLLYQGKSLPYKVFDKANRPTRIATAKEIETPRKVVKSKPSANHPWNSYPAGFSNKTLLANVTHHKGRTYTQSPQVFPA